MVGNVNESVLGQQAGLASLISHCLGGSQAAWTFAFKHCKFEILAQSLDRMDGICLRHLSQWDLWSWTT